MDVLECKQALSDYVGVFYDVLIGDIADERDHLRAALQAAMQENDGWRTLAGVLLQRNAQADVIILAARRLVAGPDSEHYTKLAAALDAYDAAMKARTE